LQHPAYHIFPLGDAGITISFGDTIDPALNKYITGLFYYFKESELSYVKDVVPAYTTLSLHYDLVEVMRLKKGHDTAYDFVVQQVQHLMENVPAFPTHHGRRIEVPVCYAPIHAPDIQALAALKNCSPDDIAAWHQSRTYLVYMIGFLPGFPYMGEVDNRLATPRKATPRSYVPAGSVGIAGHQTGIYPVASPGGWQLIGRTPLQLFNPEQTVPVLLQPGDEIVFYSITEHEFKGY
jgi:inhibitor of KinA